MGVDTGGAAFPVSDMGAQGWYGMTLRDYFAAKAMAALIVADDDTPNKCLSEMAYEIADAMLAERGKP